MGKIVKLKKFFFFLLTFFELTNIFAQGERKSVVALSRSIAQMWLLSGGTLLGTTEDALDENTESVFPLGEFVLNVHPKMQKSTISIGNLSSPNLEALLSLKPDLVLLTQDIPAHKKLFSRLKNSTDVIIVDVKTFSDYESYMNQFTKMTNRADLYEKNVVQVKNDIQNIIKSVPNHKNQSFLLLRTSSAKNKILKNHFTSEILCDLGLTPVVSDSSGLDVLSMEALFSLNPDWIFVTSQGDEKKAIQSFEADFVSRPAWKNLKAVKNGQVVFLTKELYNYKPNELWAEAYAYLYTILYGTLDKSVFSSKRHL